jgi:tetratricopeptide (TPR) repeat protein
MLSAEHSSRFPIPSDNEGARSPDQGALRAIIRRFPYWIEGRALLAKSSLEANDVATTYAEAQALLALAPQKSHYHVVALFELGRCFLRRGDARSALSFLDEAHQLNPKDSRIQEERSAALVLQGDKALALEVLKTISPTGLSAEGKAALQWLSRESSSHSSAS